MALSIGFYAQEGFIYFSDGKLPGVYSYHIESQLVSLITEDNLLKPYSVAFDSKNGYVYWTDTELKNIQRIKCNGQDQEVLLSSIDGVDQPRGIIVDTVNSKIYWVDIGHPDIYRANLDGSLKETVVNGLVMEPHDITLDLNNEKIYWTDRASKKIQRANLDGSILETILDSSDGLIWPSGLDLDLVNEKIYWTDTQDEKVFRSDFDGTGIEQIMAAEVVTPFRVKFDSFKNKIYVSEWSLNRLYSADPDGTNVQILLDANDNFEGIIGLDLAYHNEGLCNCQNSFFDFEQENCKNENFEVIINGTVYNELNPSGQEILTNSMGCDSIVNIELVFLDILEEVFEDTLCAGEEVVFDGVVYNETNIPSQLFYPNAAINGCDSLLSINIFWIEEIENVLLDTLCSGSQLIIDDQIFDESNPGGIISLSTPNGCDSVLIVDLSFFNPKIEELLYTPTGSYGEFEVTVNYNFDPLNIEWSPSNVFECSDCNSSYLQVYDSLTVTVTLDFGNDCSLNQSILIPFEAETTDFYIPNVISPNADGVNDVFFVQSDAKFSKVQEMRIFDRWGELIFEGFDLEINDLNQGWNGQFNGQPVVPGIYAYEIIISQLNGNKLEFQGSVTILQ